MTAPRVIWLCELETRNFSFAAYGETRAIADSAMLAALKVHAAQTGLADSWPLSEMEYTVSREVMLGQAYRDYSPILAKPI